ncbi:FkbM family methyltransferase, partial [Flavobacterium koreense]
MMKLKKTIKKTLSKLMPKGHAKEKIKLFYYNFSKPNKTNFSIEKKEDKTIFKTTFDGVSIYTNEGLYPIVPDFAYYQHFYKTKSGDIVIDAGANVGHLSIYFSKKVEKNGMIHCFEPDKFNNELFNQNIKLNVDLNDNIKIYDLLLWDKNEEIDFEEAGTVGSSAVWFSGNNAVVKKQAVTIDSWAKENNIKKLDFVKMDIEGAEIEALNGTIETIQTLKPNFAIATYHFVNGEPTYIKVEEFFKKLNYPYK